ncbi:MAG: PEP-utilizing enzyme [Acidipropionibacterium sp.]|nr:PEP-utilizing enzyme [Acidipropionibacterium sp.]
MTLREASVDACGGKAAALAMLLREGLPVPDGFVVPFAAHRIARSDAGMSVPHELWDALARHLPVMGDPPVAVRSSAANEDTARGSAAGQYESVLAVRGTQAVAEAVRVGWASSSSARDTGYWNHLNRHAADGEPDMAVLVQRLIDADASGVMFTPIQPGDDTRIEASWGFGAQCGRRNRHPGYLRIRVRRRHPARHRPQDDPPGSRRPRRHRPRRVGREQALPTLDDATATTLADLGGRIAALFERPQDIEWAIADGKVWILQARPITATLPPLRQNAPVAGDVSLVGTPGAHGTVTGAARVLHGPPDFPWVQPGDIAICPYTDPAWTPLFRIAAAVVTETGGVLSHAAIVAREHGIPAVLGIPHATTRIQDGTRITVNGTKGTVIPARN